MFIGATSNFWNCGPVRVAGKVMKQVDDVGRYCRIRGKEPYVGVGPRRLDVIVAGADMRVAAQSHAVLEHDQRDLGMGLEAEYAVGYVRADLFELLRPVEVAGFIESCG